MSKDEDVTAIVERLVRLARGGDLEAIKLIISRLVPPAKDKPVSLTLPKLAGSQELLEASAQVVLELAEGRLTPEEAKSVAAVLEVHRKTIELTEIERRLAALEERL